MEIIAIFLILIILLGSIVAASTEETYCPREELGYDCKKTKECIKSHKTEKRWS